MRREDSFWSSTRRTFLGTAAFMAAFCRRISAAAQTARKPPYLALAPFIQPGSDEFSGEKAAADLKRALLDAMRGDDALPLATGFRGTSIRAVRYESVARDVKRAVFDSSARDVRSSWNEWKQSLGTVLRAGFYVLPDDVVRYEIQSRTSEGLAYRVGAWKLVWRNSQIQELSPLEESLTIAARPWFRDVTSHAVEPLPELTRQLSAGIPYWRSRLDPASGIDIYGSNGIAAGDIDGDGFDEIYICQPGGLPNRLLKISPGGMVTDLSRLWGVDLLDDTSCALFLDLRNSGRQDLVVLRGSGPVLFLNEGNRYRLRADAFEFATPPLGNFTGMAAADYDRDGKLDLYLCCYVYFQSEAQYTYASPYHDAQNGPPNFLFHNELTSEGGGSFVDKTAPSGIDHNNNRFSFAPAWCDYNGDGWPDLYVANDFGRKNLYRNTEGKFRDIAAEAGVEDIGPGMSASWFDFDRDGRPDLYVANMWTDAGQRVARDPHFKPAEHARSAYQGHTMGNSLFRNRGDGAFDDVTAAQNAGFGRWAWAAGGHDLDNDGKPEIYITCGMLTNRSEQDLDSFFWRQVVARSPEKPGRSDTYENGWNAINQFVREDLSWNGHEPNVLHASRGERYYDFSGVSGLDFADDSRAFAVLDFDGDGKPDLVLKSRLGPQLRLLQNDCAAGNASIAFRLRGTRSNRDAIGARIRVDGQTRWLDAGSGFLSHHSKRVIFGLGPDTPVVKSVEILWPSGAVGHWSDLQSGRTYSIVEGQTEAAAEPFRPAKPWPAGEFRGDNSMRLEDTWFLAPVPLPAEGNGPGLFIVHEATPEFEIFRRYLFDWRAPLEPPLALLLNAKGEAVKVYGAVPSAKQVQSETKPLPLPFPGFYLKEPRRDYFKFGAAYLWAGYPDKALPYLQRVLDQAPDNARILVLVGQIYLDQNKTSEAADAFAKALKLDNAAPNAWIGLGDIAAARGANAEAQSNYAKALALDPTSAAAANGLGLALAKEGQLAEARNYFEQAIAQRRDYAEAINNLAVLYSQQGKMNDAIAAWTYGIQVAPDDGILYLNLGRAYIGLGQPDKARLMMQQLLDRDPGNATARRALEELSGR